MDPQLAQATANSKVLESAVKHLWPSMLFLVCMSLISLFGGKWWLSSLDSQNSQLIAFWLWFCSVLIVTGFATMIFVQDARIQFAKSNES